MTATIPLDAQDIAWIYTFPQFSANGGTTLEIGFSDNTPSYRYTISTMVAILLYFGYNPSMFKTTPNTTPILVVCRKTGRTYDPRTEFLKVMETKEVREVMVRLKNR